MNDTNSTRKPQPPQKEPAQLVLNKFLSEKGILIGLNRPTVDFTNNGGIVIAPPAIVAVYQEDTKN